MSFVFRPIWQAEGVGGVVRRVIANQHLKRLDPFLLLDYFKVKLPGGFPDHPHRGFETVTYLKKGRVYHEDFKGHKGSIGPGDIQWMTAGKGIIHCEMPASFEQETVGFQLWLNLKSHCKMQDPKYQDYKKQQIPTVDKDGARVKLICGEWEGVKGPINYSTPVYYMDIQLEKGRVFEIPIKKTWNSIIYVYEGSAEYSCGTTVLDVKNQNCCVLEKSETRDLVHTVRTSEGANFILISGQPLNEPIVSKRLFVMNTREEVEQAQKDYDERTNGFECRDKWESKIKQLASGKKYQQL